MVTNNQDSKPITSTDRVYSAVQELRAAEQIATRETVAELTQLTQSVVDDRLRALVDNGRLKRLLRGIYELVEVYPPMRVISKTILSNYMVKLDIGDDVITLTPAEARVLAELSVGAAGVAAMVNSTTEHLFLATSLAAKVEKLEREIKAYRRIVDANPAQMDLIGGG